MAKMEDSNEGRLEKRECKCDTELKTSTRDESEITKSWFDREELSHDCDRSHRNLMTSVLLEYGYNDDSSTNVEREIFIGLMMDRKEQRVGLGVGAFHNPPRAKYSEETRNLIKVLMEESKLSMMQRKSIQSAVDRGESLPQSLRTSTNSSGKSEVNFPCYWKKRSQKTIASSGAYEREQYRRTAPLPNADMQKRHLACMMAYGKDMPPTPHGPKIHHRSKTATAPPEDVDPLRDLVQGIRERIEFLNEMEHLGHGKKYRPIIHQEIAQKIRMIESLDNGKSAEIHKEVEQFKYERPIPKPFPMGELEDS